MEKIHWIVTNTDPEVKIRCLEVIPPKIDEQKPTIIILPGWLSRIESRSVLINEFAKFFRVIMMEPRGFGESTKPAFKGAYTIEALTDELRIVLEYFELQDNDFVIFASSVTSALTLLYLTREIKPKPLALALISPPQHYDEPFWMKILSVFPLPFLIGIRDLIFKILIWRAKSDDEKKNLRQGQQKLRDANPRSQIRFYKEFLRNYDIRKDLAKIDIPMIAFTPSYDRLTPIEESEDLTRLHPLSEYHKFEKKSHRIIDENEERIAQLTEKFIRKILA